MLFSIAYRMLGAVADAEDAVQETHLRWSRTRESGEDIRSSKSWLTTAVSRICLDQLGSARVKREQYVGPWLPEPLAGISPDIAETAGDADSLSVAFLVLLEPLSPKERAVFLLHDVFGYGFAEIASIVTGVQTVVYPSFAYVYPDSGDAWIDAAATPPDPIDSMRSTVVAEGEVARYAASSADGARRGVSLRLGGLYGPDVPSIADQLDLAAKGVSVFGAARSAYVPMLWIDDAASALVAALERAPSGLYDVVNDEPITQSALHDALAVAVGKRRLLALPKWLIRTIGGPTGATFGRSLRISNRRFREATGWAPSVHNGRVGLARIAAERKAPPRLAVPVPVKIGL